MSMTVRDLALDRYPNLVEHVAYHQRPPGQKRHGESEFVLDLILDGLERAGGSS